MEFLCDCHHSGFRCDGFWEDFSVKSALRKYGWKEAESTENQQLFRTVKEIGTTWG